MFEGCSNTLTEQLIGWVEHAQILCIVHQGHIQQRKACLYDVLFLCLRGLKEASVLPRIRKAQVQREFLIYHCANTCVLSSFLNIHRSHTWFELYFERSSV